MSLSPSLVDPFRLDASEIRRWIDPGAPNLPELERARRELDSLRAAPQTRILLSHTEALLEGAAAMPQTTYSDYRRFIANGDRTRYEAPYFLKRSRLAAAALRWFLGDVTLKATVQDYIWSICEESTWVLPAHEKDMIDLFAAETAYELAEALQLLGGLLDDGICTRVRTLVQERVFDPYLRFHDLHWWYRSGMNWNGVCNSSVAAAFLLLEPEPGRVACALEIALAGLRVYLDTAFETDGSSTEGVGYWQYGLINFVALSETLRARTHGALDILSLDRVRQIAAYPSMLLLSPSRFAAFSDCEESHSIQPGIMARLAERSREASLRNLMTAPVTPEPDWRLMILLRGLLWWDGTYEPAVAIADAFLPSAGMVRLTARTRQNVPVVVAAKAGHNDENHNHNDVGSFIVHVGDESLLCDPGRGLYTRDYFRGARYENLFANSYGHSVPRIGGKLQKPGREHGGHITAFEPDRPIKSVEMQIERAYSMENLASLCRRLTVDAAGAITLDDSIRFSSAPWEVEEAFVTWCDVAIAGPVAVVRGERSTLRLAIQSPADAQFALERLEKASIENGKPQILKRLSITVPARLETSVRVRMELVDSGE